MPRTWTVVLLTSKSIGWADVRASLAMLSEVSGAADIRDPDALIATVSQVQPDALLMPTQIDGVSMLPLIASIREALVHVPQIVVFSHDHDQSELAEDLRAGASGYIVFSDVDTDDLPAELRSLIVSGVMLLSRSTREILRRLLATCPTEAEWQEPRLSERERFVLRGLARGLSRKEIGKELGLSVRTTDRTTALLCRKLRVTTSHELIAKAAHINLLHER